MMQLGETFHLDTIDIDKCYNEEENDEVIQQITENYYHSQAFNWPYYSFAIKADFVIILNAFNTSFV